MQEDGDGERLSAAGCGYNRRFSCAGNLFVQKSRLHINLTSFPAFGTRLWNCLHPDWRKLTKRAFKRKIHKLLLTVIEDYYVDAHSLVLNLNKSNYKLYPIAFKVAFSRLSTLHLSICFTFLPFCLINC